MKYQLITEREFIDLEEIASKWVDNHSMFSATDHKYAAMEFYFNQQGKTMYFDLSTQYVGDTK